MEIEIKAKGKIKTINSSDFEKIKELSEYLSDKYDSGFRSCQNCKFHNKEKISCSHTYWYMCVVRDSDGYVVKYNCHHFR